MYPFSPKLPSHTEFRVLYSRSLLVIHFKYKDCVLLKIRNKCNKKSALKEPGLFSVMPQWCGGSWWPRWGEDQSSENRLAGTVWVAGFMKFAAILGVHSNCVNEMGIYKEGTALHWVSLVGQW